VRRALRHAGSLVSSGVCSLWILKPTHEGCHWWNNNSIELFTEVCLTVMTSDVLSLLINLTELRSQAST